MTSSIRGRGFLAPLLGLVALAACGGGGGGSGAPVASAPPPPANPPAAPAPPPVNYNSAEYSRSSAIAMNAIAAYNAGATGKGVTVGVIDSGIDTGSAEFSGRIHAASTDAAGSRGITDTHGHGTSVAAVLGAARNDTSIMGAAFDATLLVLRTDEPGTCTPNDGCSHRDNDIANAVNIAAANQARVINLSLGGSAPGVLLRTALANATAQGIVVVISAGNDSNADPDDFAMIATDAGVARGQIIIAGSHGTSNTLSAFSNAAGNGMTAYLTALGEKVSSFDHQGTGWLYSGTSYAAPQIAGAAALLAQAFPNLTGAQIVALLYDSAIDLGDPGVDPVYGRGRLSLTRAFAPQGSTALAGSQTPISLAANGALGGPLGDGGQLAKGLGGAIILDGYSRAYAVDLARTLTLAPRAPGLSARLTGRASAAGFGTGATSVAVSIEPGAGDGAARITAMRVSGQDAATARARAFSIAQRLGQKSSIAFGFNRDASGLSAGLAGVARPAFLIAEEGHSLSTIEHRPQSAFALAHRLDAKGRLRLTVSAEEGAILTPDARRWRKHGYSLIGTGFEADIGPATLRAGTAILNEQDTLLGSTFSAAFGIGGARTLFLDTSADIAIGRGWALSLAARHGFSRAALSGGIAQDMRTLRSRALSAEIDGSDLLVRGDSLALRIARPLRVDAGGIGVAIPTAYDHQTRGTMTERRYLGLAPSGQEMSVEAVYGMGIGPGRLTGNAFWRKEPGHIATAPADIGMALRFSASF